MARPFIPPELAAEARDTLARIMRMSPSEQRGMAYAQKAAADLIRFYQTQEHYDFKQPAANYERSAANPRTLAGKLDRLTEDEILEMQAQLTHDYPGKPA